MASRACQISVARSELLGKADRNRYRHAIEVASGIGVLSPHHRYALHILRSKTTPLFRRTLCRMLRANGGPHFPNQGLGWDTATGCPSNERHLAFECEVLGKQLL
jgi:hypothetical protein